MTGKLKTAVISTCFWNKKLYEVKSNIEMGEMPDPEEVGKIVHELEKANNKRVSVLKMQGENNVSSTFMEDITFRDNGELIEGQLFGPISGAIDFINEQSESNDLFMQQMAMNVAICL